MSRTLQVLPFVIAANRTASTLRSVLNRRALVRGIFISLGLVLGVLLFGVAGAEQDLWLEAESFATLGGWVIDQQSMAQMGSAYVMAHGMGIPVRGRRNRLQNSRERPVDRLGAHARLDGALEAREAGRDFPGQDQRTRCPRTWEPTARYGDGRRRA